MISKNLFRLLSPVLGLLVFSCGPTEKETQAYDEETEVIYSEKTEALFHNMVSPGELPYALMAIGADFDPAIPNDPSKAERYRKDESMAAVNLGIYVSDLSYVIAYDQFELAQEYYKAGNDLAESIGEGRIFNQAILRDYGDKIENDTAVMQLQEAILKARVNLKENERIRMGTLILSGIFIERLYMLTQILTNYPGEDLPDDVKQNVLAPLMTAVYRQKEPLNSLIEYINEIIQPNDRRIVYDELIALQQEFEDLGSVWETGDADALALLNDQDFVEIAERVKKIRALAIREE